MVYGVDGQNFVPFGMIKVHCTSSNANIKLVYSQVMWLLLVAWSSQKREM